MQIVKRHKSPPCRWNVQQTLVLLLCLFLMSGEIDAQTDGFTPAATITVNSLLDTVASDGLCTLREAIQSANTNSAIGGCAAGAGADSIDLSGIVGTINLGSPLPTLTSPISISAGGAGLLKLQRAANAPEFRLLTIIGANVTLSSMTLANGQDASGGAILVDASGGSAQLTIQDSIIRDSKATSSGGAIFNAGATLTLTNTLFEANSAGSSGGAVYTRNGTLTATRTAFTSGSAGSSGGGLFSVNTAATLTNVTVSNNSASSAGGGIYLSGAAMSLNNVTIAENSAAVGGGVQVETGTFNFANTIISTNLGGDCGGTLNTQGYNLLGTAPGCTVTGVTTGNLLNVSPLLALLSNNGGITTSHALLLNSPALNAGNPAAGCATSDQRGVARPQGGRCDIGAYEAVAVTPVDAPDEGTVLRGLVTNRAGIPLADVAVSVLNQPGFGSATTGIEGTYSLAIPLSGEPITVEYTKAGFLTVQRKVVGRADDYAWADDVIMIPLDSAVTSVTMNAAGMQIVRGNPVTDSSGTRRATLLVPAGTTAVIQLAGGGTQNPTSLNIRATEYTVGATNEAAMPGELPPTSGYTYALEYSADQAPAGSNIQFNQPVIHYVENFLDFDVGWVVPSGAYDRRTGAWVASPNGRVVKIISIDAGSASIDTTGDGTADNTGISAAERQALATLYAAGQELWRVPMTHFTPWDYNWPYGPPPNAIRPPRIRPYTDRRVDSYGCQRGSLVECQNQTLGETIPITGTEFALHYRSDRVPGRAASDTISIPISDNRPLPPDLRRIEVQIEVAGQRINQTFPPLPNQQTTVAWNGFDIYGRRANGLRSAFVQLRYIYPARYYEASADFTQSFGVVGTGSITQDRERGEITIYEAYRVEVGAHDNRRATDLGGWSLDAHHFYDTRRAILYRGDGSRRSAEWYNSDLITSVAGNGTSTVVTGGQATASGLFTVRGLAAAADGSFYFSTGTGEPRIYKVDANGILTVYAGNGTVCSSGACGDGGQAVNAQLHFVEALEMGADGSLYIVHGVQARRIRKIAPNGIITTIAGSGTTCTPATAACGDGGPATAAALGNVTDIAAAPDGTLYIADPLIRRVRRIGTDGIISTLAGTGVTCLVNEYPCGVGGRANQARLTPYAVAVAPDGSLVIGGTDFIYRVTPDGNIAFIAGCNGGTSQCPLTGDKLIGANGLDANLETITRLDIDAEGNIIFGHSVIFYGFAVLRLNTEGVISGAAGRHYANNNNCPASTNPCGDGGPAELGLFNLIEGVEVARDGSILIADYFDRRVRRVYSPLGIGAGTIAIPSADGAEVYVFNPSGRHLQTRHALTGATLYTFGYDANGRLITITDGSSNVTTIQRNGAGVPTAIVSPYNQTTMLVVGGNGFLTTVTNPTSQSYAMVYTSEGLLTAFTDPNSRTSQFTYDSQGRLIRHDDAGGGFYTLARSEVGDDSSVTVTTEMGRSTVYTVQVNEGGEIKTVDIFPDGTTRSMEQRLNGTSIITARDGTTLTQTLAPDPRFGSQVSYPVTAVGQAGTQTTQITGERTVTLTNPIDPFSINTLTDIRRINFLPFTLTYTGASRTFSYTTPVGRTSGMVIDPQGRPTQTTTGGLLPISYTYDSRGRLQTMTQGARTFTIAYNAQGFVSSITDPLSRVTSFTYNAAGRLTSATHPGGRTFNYVYDALGNLVSLTPPGRPAHQLGYTPVYRLASYTPPDVVAGTDATTYAYNADHQLTSITRPDGQTVSLAYNAGGRLGSMSMPGRTVNYTYANSLITGANVPGSVNLALTYQGDRVMTQTWSGAVNGTLEFNRDSALRIQSIEIGFNSTFFNYDSDGLLSGAGLLSLTRSAQNGLLTGTSMDAVDTDLTYNGFGELLTHTADANGSPVYSASYTRDNLGRITALSETVSGTTTNFVYSYDTAGRLASVTRNGTPFGAYTYDGMGNRLTTPTATYDNQDRLLTAGGVSYTYNAHGERITRVQSGQTTTYSYDALGNLTNVALPGGTQIGYVNDGLNRRVGRRVNGALVSGYLYQDSQRIAAELNGAGEVVARYIYIDDGITPAYIQKDFDFYRVISDHIGSVRLVIDVATGDVVQRMDYDAWGNVIADTNPGFQPFGFAGGLYDPQTKLYHFGARDYDPEVGRWLTKDPAGFFSGDANLYAYALNDPVNFVDRNGMWSISVSFYSGIGGGVSIGGQGLSINQFGIELGVGIGSGVDIDSAGGTPIRPELMGSQMTIFGELEGRVGTIRGKVGFESVEDCPGEFGGPELKRNLCFGPVCYDGQNVAVRGDPWAEDRVNQLIGRESGAKVEGKAGIRLMFGL